MAIYHPSLVYLGHVAVFYVPIQKLDQVEFGTGKETPRQLFHAFLMDNYYAYTLELSDTQGFWLGDKNSQICHDHNARYEVSFDGKDKIEGFVSFLSEMCFLLKEQAMYVTMGHKAYLVVPKENNEV